jgi:hypothetical protein
LAAGFRPLTFAAQINAMPLMTPPDQQEMGYLHEACHLILRRGVVEQNQISLCQICANRKHAFLHRSAKGYIYSHSKYLYLLLFLLGFRMSGGGTPFPNEGRLSERVAKWLLRHRPRGLRIRVFLLARVPNPLLMTWRSLQARR